MFSKPILGTEKTRIKMSQWEYIFSHCIPTGFQSIRSAFISWMYLVWFTDNQKYYTLLKDDDPVEQCRLTFLWDLEDEVYPKEC